jgi:hypothetical protein
MVLAVKAWRWREEARDALAAGEFGRAFALAGRAQEAQRTDAGAALRSVAKASLGDRGPGKNASAI